MSLQIGQWIEQNLSEPYVLCGHSLGGKVAMAHACSKPNHLQGLVVVDIAPRDYPPEHHLPTLDALLGLELSRLERFQWWQPGLRTRLQRPEYL